LAQHAQEAFAFRRPLDLAAEYRNQFVGRACLL
jgi:hypothetical protein